ncbi:PREDICTED: uncharacterized protein LOC104593138 isoform X2 [Nelumbo nucifera]|nr:PREDICTED: uncharacterized protein LOC104593138 isoform X2 [Nelumbo nucifera]DAD34512.1 TPA_asm: hypothetical protein HUJ06_005152 [Nelumbo nucifera]
MPSVPTEVCVSAGAFQFALSSSLCKWKNLKTLKLLHTCLMAGWILASMSLNWITMNFPGPWLRAENPLREEWRRPVFRDLMLTYCQARERDVGSSQRNAGVGSSGRHMHVGESSGARSSSGNPSSSGVGGSSSSRNDGSAQLENQNADVTTSLAASFDTVLRNVFPDSPRGGVEGSSGIRIGVSFSGLASDASSTPDPEPVDRVISLDSITVPATSFSSGVQVLGQPSSDASISRRSSVCSVSEGDVVHDNTQV